MRTCGEIEFSVRDELLGMKRMYRARCRKHKFKGNNYYARSEAERELRLHRWETE